MMTGREHDGLTDLTRDPVGTGTEWGRWVILHYRSMTRVRRSRV